MCMYVLANSEVWEVRIMHMFRDFVENKEYQMFNFVILSLSNLFMIFCEVNLNKQINAWISEYGHVYVLRIMTTLS